MIVDENGKVVCDTLIVQDSTYKKGDVLPSKHAELVKKKLGGTMLIGSGKIDIGDVVAMNQWDESSQRIHDMLRKR
jgi:hypothetical protein